MHDKPVYRAIRARILAILDGNVPHCANLNRVDLIDKLNIAELVTEGILRKGVLEASQFEEDQHWDLRSEVHHVVYMYEDTMDRPLGIGLLGYDMLLSAIERDLNNNPLEVANKLEALRGSLLVF